MIGRLLEPTPRGRRRRARFRFPDIARAEGSAAERMLLSLERKRLLDAVWVLTFGLQLAMLALAAWLGTGEQSAAGLARHVLVGGAAFVVLSDLAYRLATPRAVDLSLYASQLAGVALLAWWWQLSGGLAQPAGLALFAPPLVAAGLALLRGLPALSAGLALACVWGVAWRQTGDLPWDLARALAGEASPQLIALLAWSGALTALGLASSALAGLLMRFYQRLRSQSELTEEARGMFESVMSGAAEPSVVVYADTCQVVHASDSFLRRMLLEPEEAAGRSLFNLLHFEERERVEMLFEQRAGEVPFQVIRLGREKFVVNLHFFHTRHDGTRYLHVAFREVTDLYWFRKAFDAMDDALVIVGTAGELLYANRSAGELLGELYVGKPMAQLLSSQRLLPRGGLAAARSQERVEVQGFPFHLTVSSPRLGPEGGACHVFWLHGFAEEEARADRATRDALTGLHNRRYFERRLAQLVRDTRSDEWLALALWNLDDFKCLNEALGREGGDAVLREVARLLGEELGPEDCLCRIDGDTFGLALPGRDAAAAETIVERLFTALAQATTARDARGRPISTSVGLAMLRPGESVAALVARADDALYEAKEGGGGCYVLREPAE